MLRNSFYKCATIFVITLSICTALTGQDIPLPEHPRPDFERATWINLNGNWDFAFDSLHVGEEDSWFTGKGPYPDSIQVPFPWGSALSGLDDLADVGWYRRKITVPSSWESKRTFLTIGASDWETTLWLDGVLVGNHRGGYIPFSFELTEFLKYSESQTLVIRVDDARRDFTLYGKQGYGNARGIWQTVYLEARGPVYLDALHFLPDIDNELVEVRAYLPMSVSTDQELSISIQTDEKPITHRATLTAGSNKLRFTVEVPDPHLWSLDDPHLYWVNAKLGQDEVSTYFGMRKISTTILPNSDHIYVSLNNQPIYLQMALDQSYHPDGFYTFPSDQFLQEEIDRSKKIGLNGIRTHIKVEVPRKLYWADKKGLLVMEDLPNSWGEPDASMQAESEYTLRQMIKRDFNHPGIFSWCVFNETWGLKTQVQDNGVSNNRYLPETQDWVASMYYLAKSLDQTRLVEDNSICCGYGHTETDLNSWHHYLPGWAWPELLQTISDSTYGGSPFHFEDGFTQGRQPNFNSECGNVWGYEGSTGDVDWSWDYHRMLNTFRMFPKVAGWLYTEHHDVINEWNGYWRFDRTEKYTGFEQLYPGMKLEDLHSAIYLSTGNEICQTVQGGEIVEVPLFLSCMSGEDHGEALTIRYELSHTNYIGETEKNLSDSMSIKYTPWMQTPVDPLRLKLPEMAGLAILRIQVENTSGGVLHRNFMHFEVQGGSPIYGVQVVQLDPTGYSDADWSIKTWAVRGGRKVNGTGNGSFTYTFALPENTRRAKEAYFLVEASAKELFVKDQEDFDGNQDYMRGSVVAPSSNPNAYPMTDETLYPSIISVWIDGKKVKTSTLVDDPADHRGVLSWHHQLTDRKLREAGSYGYLIKVPISRSAIRSAVREGRVEVQIKTEDSGGLAIFGKEFGQYPFDPSIVLIMD